MSLLKLIFLFIFLSLFEIEQVNGKFLSTRTITEGLSQPFYPSHVFFYYNTLYATVDVLNGFSLGMNSSLIQYNSNGQIEKNLTFPLTCSTEDCNVNTLFITLEENIIYLLIETRSEQGAQIAIFSVNLNTFSITNKVFASYNLFPNAWLPFSSLTSYFASNLNDNKGVSITPFDLSKLSLSTTNNGTIDINYAQTGGANEILADNNLLIVCGQFTTAYEYSHFYLLNLMSEKNEGSMQIEGNCGFSCFLNDSSSLIAISTSEITSSDIYLSLIDIKNGLPLNYNGVNVYKGGEVNGIHADSSYIFLSITTAGDQGALVQYQYNNSNNNNFNGDFSFIKLDEVNVTSNYHINDLISNIQSLGINPTTQQLAVTIISNNINQNPAIFLVDYD